MRRWRARRRQADPRVAIAAAPAVAGAATLALGAVDPALGFVAGAALSAAASAFVYHRSTRLRAGLADLDSALVNRALSHDQPASDDTHRFVHDACRGVKRSVQVALAQLRASLRAQSALVMWTRASDRTVRIREAESCVASQLVTGPFPFRGSGLEHIPADGAVVAPHSDGHLPWYDAGDQPASAIIVPIDRDGVVIGYLAVDRPIGDQPLDEIDALAVVAAARQIALAIHMEFLVLEAEVGRRDVTALTETLSKLGDALTVDDVCRRTREILASFVEFDGFFATERCPESGDHRVVFASGEVTEPLLGRSFATGDDIVSFATSTREMYPYDRRNVGSAAPVIGTERLHGFEAVLAIPLSVEQSGVGSICIVARRRDAFSLVPKALLEILSNQLPAALNNALMYAEMVREATTDGLTGLTNRRTFNERGADALARANRSGRPLSVIITDIDHFKSVNDTHGHGVGDEVIQGVASVLASSARDVDITARYGGEEFAILLEETDAETAAVIAERIREAVRALRFEGDEGPFGVTISLGVAEYGGGKLGTLVDQADHALYDAKHGGRNQVCVATTTNALAA